MYSQRTLKSGDFQRCSPQLRPYPSKYISTASSPKLQPWLQTSLDYSAYNDPQTVPLDELEPFPDFVDIWDHWEEDDDDFGVQDAYMQHCIVHCNQRVCRWNTQHTKSAEGKEWKCTRRCESRKSNLPAVPAFGKDSLDKLTRKAVEVADRAYEKMNGQEMLTIDLQSALAIVERLNNIGILDFKFHLIGSPRFTASTLLHGRDYVRAAMDANSFIKKLSAYFSTSLTLLPGQTRPISICDLEEEMQKYTVASRRPTAGKKAKKVKKATAIKKSADKVVKRHTGRYNTRMGKFTMSDFTAIVTTTLDRPKRPARITVPASNLRLPVAPPSPYFDGINTHINTEPFPNFMDIIDSDGVKQVESLHCVLHCHETICRRMKLKGRKIPPCRCALEQTQPVKTKPPRPTLHIYDSVMHSLGVISAQVEPKQELDIHLIDIDKLLVEMENHAATRALQDHDLLDAFRRDELLYEATTALETVECFFDDMRVYFSNTLRESGHRVLSVQQLRAELNVYVWTMLGKCIERYYEPKVAAQVSRFDMRLFRKVPWIGASCAVLKIWTVCSDDVVGMMIWRDNEVRRFEAEQGVASFKLGHGGFYILLVVILLVAFLSVLD
ncbi:Nn.00g011360.m01.CDS01 [Neocucurbitaria sp. VM-36]